MRRKLLHLFLTILVAASAFAQQRADEAAPSVERLRASVTYLASDELEGRRTGSRGAEMAAEYIAREFSRYGLRRSVGVDLPGMSILEAESPHRYMPEFPFVAGVELGKNNVMLFTPRGEGSASVGVPAKPLDLQLGEDWIPLGFSASGHAEELAVVFVGYGITAADLKYDDYAGVNVKGRIALALAGTPDGYNPHGEFARYGDERWKSIAAREHGAAALLLIASEDNFKQDHLSHLSYDNSAGDAGLPVAVVSRQVARRILEAGGLQPPADLEKGLREKRSQTGAPAGGVSLPVAQKTLSVPLQNVALSITTEVVRRYAPAYNVVGILYGRDPKLKDEAIVIGAHYDHLGRGGEGSLAAREGEIHHGADDNASGTAALLELARIFSAERQNLRRTIIFIAFGGEEEGLLGSSYYVNHPVVPRAETVAMINMDMIGRLKENKLIVGGVGTSQEWREWLASANLLKGMTANADSQRTRGSGSAPVATSTSGTVMESSDRGQQFALMLNEDGYGPSDHSSFYAKHIPVLFFWTGAHEDYHKPSDTADKINYEGEARIISLVADVVRSIDRSDRRPTYTVARSESSGRPMGFRVYLGTIPNYAESTTGLTLEGVRDNSPASRAGLKAGDRIIKMAGRDVHNIYDYTYALGEMNAGQEYEVEVVRAGGQTLKLKITPSARK